MAIATNENTPTKAAIVSKDDGRVSCEALCRQYAVLESAGKYDVSRALPSAVEASAQSPLKQLPHPAAAPARAA